MSLRIKARQGKLEQIATIVQIVTMKTYKRSLFLRNYVGTNFERVEVLESWEERVNQGI